MDQKPTVGRIVHYTLGASDADQINKRRADAEARRSEITSDSLGYMAHVGNRVEAGQVLPMVIVRVWSDASTAAVNGQVFLDGNDLLWRCSASFSDEPKEFCWSWPPRV